MTREIGGNAWQVRASSCLQFLLAAPLAAPPAQRGYQLAIASVDGCTSSCTIFIRPCACQVEKKRRAS